jgi:hypothetical protein
VPAGLWLSVAHPTVFWVALAGSVIVSFVLIWVFFRFLRGLFKRFGAPREDLPALPLA